MTDDNGVLAQEVHNLASLVEELNETVTVAMKEFRMVATYLEKKTGSRQMRSESSPFASLPWNLPSRLQNPSRTQNGQDERPSGFGG
jgi:hypothetical protein